MESELRKRHRTPYICTTMILIKARKSKKYITTIKGEVDQYRLTDKFPLYNHENITLVSEMEFLIRKDSKTKKN